MLEGMSQTLFRMFYAAPALLHPLVRKCHDENHQIDCEAAVLLKQQGFLSKNGNVPASVKRTVLARIKLNRKSGKISMKL